MCGKLVAVTRVFAEFVLLETAVVFSQGGLKKHFLFGSLSPAKAHIGRFTGRESLSWGKDPTKRGDPATPG